MSVQKNIGLGYQNIGIDRSYQDEGKIYRKRFFKSMFDQ